MPIFQAKLRVREIIKPVIFTNATTLVAVTTLLLLGTPMLVAVAVLPVAEAINVYLLLRFLKAEINISFPDGALVRRFNCSKRVPRRGVVASIHRQLAR